MGYAQLFGLGWSWGNLLGEGVGAFLFTLILVIGSRYAGNSNTPLARRMMLAGVVLVAVLLGAFVSLGISELYRRSSGAPILTPVFGLFYAFIIGSYSTVGIIIVAQLVGSLVGFVLAVALRPRARAELLTGGKVGFKGGLWRSLAIVVLLVCVAVVSLINPTAYGGTFVLKIIIMALLFTAFIAVFGRVEFYSYTSLYEVLSLFCTTQLTVTSLSRNPRVVVRSLYNRNGVSVELGLPLICRIGVVGLLMNRHLQALMLQFVALGVLIGVYSLVQTLPNAGEIANVI